MGKSAISGGIARIGHLAAGSGVSDCSGDGAEIYWEYAIDKAGRSLKSDKNKRMINFH